MNVFRIEIVPFNPRRYDIEESIKELGFKKEAEIYESRIYWIKGNYEYEEIKRIAEEILCEDIVENYKINERFEFEGNDFEITYHFGVKDPVCDSVEESIELFGFKKPEEIKRGRRYWIKGDFDEKEIDYIARKFLYNPVIERKEKIIKYIFLKPSPYKFEILYVPILSFNDDQLLNYSKEKGLALNLSEMKKIKDYFSKMGRNPTDCEIETIAQTWSEHCVHKTFKGKYYYGEEYIDNLLKTYIIKVSEEIKKDFYLVLFKDNAGIIEFDEEDAIAVKVETHNHPSAIEPYGGASTGIGGVIRDILGAGKGAKPIANIDVFCVGPLDFPHEKLLEGVLHPKRILKGIVAGVRDYGNRMGIPTCAGAVYIDNGFITNPLVYCGTIGIMPKKYAFKNLKPGYKILLAGGKTGKDGIHGVTFASCELEEKSEEVSIGAVQIGDPITEKKLQDALLEARDKDLIEFVTDCGGGGLSSAIGESAQITGGAKVFLDEVPLKYEGLSYTEIWISESQERMIIGAKEENIKKIEEIFKKYSCDIKCIGEYTDSGKLELFYKDQKVCEIDIDFLHKGRPEIIRKVKKFLYKEEDLNFEPPFKPEEALLKLLSSPNICSRESIIRQYDHEVQGKSCLKPLIGYKFFSPQDAVCIKPKFNSNKKIAISIGLCPSYSYISPYWMAANAIDEAIRNLICVGANPDKIALLDNFCFANPEDEEVMAEIIECCKACYDIAKAYKTPFISGKDSLYNEFKTKDLRVKIPATLLITGIGIVEDEIEPVSASFKKEGNLIYLIGETNKELGSSEYLKIMGIYNKGFVPKVYPEKFLKYYEKIYEAIKKGYILSAHDVSQGGIGVAISESLFANEKGAFIKIESSLRWDEFLFSESAGRIIVEVEKDKKEEFEKIFNGLPLEFIGEVIPEKELRIEFNGEIIIKLKIEKMYREFSKPLI
ncbi:MAG: phosphoribosylformylglycinamidine synthase subunit PurL [candidate division WOR-3 bacterium]